MKYYKYDILTRHGDTEASETYLTELKDDTDLEAHAHKLGQDYYGRVGGESSFDEHMEAYWWPNGEGVTFVPGFEEVSEADYKTLLRIL